MEIKRVVIANPIINSPFEEPRLHFRFSEQGITDEITPGRRQSEYFVPIARPRKKGQQQLAFDPWTQDRIQPNEFINRVRGRVELWRRGGYVGIARTTRRYGNLTVLTARMNPDLSMGDTLLKKTGSGNLFMVFGEPDVEIRQDNGKIIVEIKGVDIYDPTTGEIRASSTADIACWFIDTNYNEESFFVRQAYFTGADKPYEKLKRALRAEVDEDAWSALYSTISRPFDPPEMGKIAVKVINHYGDEVLHVYEV